MRPIKMGASSTLPLALLSLPTILLTTLAVADLTARPSSTGARRRTSVRGEFRLGSGRRFQHYRFALTFRLPVASLVRITPRGLFPQAEVTPLDGEDFYIVQTTLLIRRPEELKNLSGEIRVPCRLPALPDRPRFRETVECRETTGGNLLERKILLIREDAHLHVLYAVWRREKGEEVRKIFDSVEKNSGFHAPTPSDGEKKD